MYQCKVGQKCSWPYSEKFWPEFNILSGDTKKRIDFKNKHKIISPALFFENQEMALVIDCRSDTVSKPTDAMRKVYQALISLT